MSGEHTGPQVFKFGGTSVGSAERIRDVAELVARAGEPVVVVVSAMAGVTNTLVRLAEYTPGAAVPEGEESPREAVKALRARHLATMADLELSEEESAFLHERINARLDRVVALLSDDGGLEHAARSDAILSAGEDLSALLVAAALRARKTEARWVDARALVHTDERYGKAVPLHEKIRDQCAEHLLPVLEDGVVAVVQGFVGSSPRGTTTTLGRGGSDFTATLLGAAIDSRLVHIWTDVDGILSGDPRVVDAPRRLSEIGAEEAVELAYFGARVIHSPAAVQAVMHRVPLRIRSTFEPDAEGTLIRSDRRSAAKIAAVAGKSGVAMIKVRALPWALPYGFLANVFGVLSAHRTPVDLVATSHSSTAFTVDESEQLDAVVKDLSEFAEVEVRRGLATVTVVGHGLMQEPGMEALVFWAVEKTPVHLISQASDVSLSFLVDQEHAADVVRRLHTSLIELRAAAGAVGPEHVDPVVTADGGD